MMFKNWKLSRFFSGGLSATHHVRKFYKNVTIEPFVEADDKGFTVRLDGRSAKTADGHKYFVPTEYLAHLVALEFLAQEEYIVANSMPLVDNI